MKINDVEQLLRISKANIRFYEKEGLLTPERTEKGYRVYSEADLSRLKDIIILRKLGIPVQQIQDILDGALPLQEALDSSIATLKEEIEKLNGSLTLCQQLKQENTNILDTQRYWELIQDKERQGDRFLSLARDYWNFMRPITEAIYWYVPEDGWKKPRIFIKYILIACIILAGIDTVLYGDSYLIEFAGEVAQRIGNILIWSVVLLPAYLLARKNQKKGENMLFYTVIFMIVLCLILFIVLLTRSIIT